MKKMDFNEISKLNLNNFSSSFKIKKDDVHSDEKIYKKLDNKKSPYSPAYWQNAVGVKKSDISFKGKDNLNNSEYINPVTKVFDKSLFEKAEEFKNRPIEFCDIHEVVIASVDSKTGKISPLADALIDFLFPYQSKETLQDRIKSIKGNIKQRVKVSTGITIDEAERDLVGVINSIKDKNGEFSNHNLQYFYKILRQNRDENTTCQVRLSKLANLMEVLKNEDGLVSENKFNIASKLLRQTSSYTETELVMSSFLYFPEEKLSDIYDLCISIGNDKYTAAINMLGFSNFCFDENGEIKKDNVEYLKELVKNNDIEYNPSLLELLDKKPHLKEFIKEIMSVELPHYGTGTYVEIIRYFDTDEKTMTDFEKEKIREYLRFNKTLKSFVPLYKACYKDGHFDEELYQKALRFTQMDRKNVINGDLCAQIVGNELFVANMKFKNRVEILDALRTIKKDLDNYKIIGFEFIEKAISDLEFSLALADIGLPITEKAKKDFLSNIVRSTHSENEYTKFEQIMIDSIPYFENTTTGIPLTYQREDFLNDLSDICKTNDDFEILTKKTDIQPILIGSKIVGYNGLIKLSDLNIENPKEKQIYDCMYRYMYDNSANTGNKELDKQLNYILKACPEFMNVIGKKQHGTQKYTVDIHSLLLMAYSIQEPDYTKKLDVMDKALLKTCAIFHDIMKKEGVVDKGHQYLSSWYAKGITKKIFVAQEIQDRLFELIDNHHWTEEYSTASNKKEKAQELAFRFRRPNDFEISKIMARSDIKAVNLHFYERLKYCLENENLKPIKDNLDKLYSTGNALFTDKVISSRKMSGSVEERDGKKYNVINMHEIPNDADMGEYGFTYGKKKNDLVFLVHMINDGVKCSIYQEMNTVKLLSSAMNGGVLSESIITPYYKRTYGNRKYGLLLSQINTNIINEAENNQGSGRAKSLEKVKDLIFNDRYDRNRCNFRNSLLKNLGINTKSVSDEEYCEFYKKVLARKTSLSQIKKQEIYRIGNHSVSGEDLVFAIKKFQDELIDKTGQNHNEIVGYAPKINAVIVKEKFFKNIPDEVLKFAYENKLPIVMV